MLKIPIHIKHSGTILLLICFVLFIPSTLPLHSQDDATAQKCFAKARTLPPLLSEDGTPAKPLYKFTRMQLPLYNRTQPKNAHTKTKRVKMVIESGKWVTKSTPGDSLNVERYWLPEKIKSFQIVLNPEHPKNQGIFTYKTIEYYTKQIPLSPIENQKTENVEILCATHPRIIIQIQIELKVAQFYSGALNGHFNSETRKAFYAYQKANGLPVGSFNLLTLERLNVRF